MTSGSTETLPRLSELRPTISADQLAAQLVPPRQFAQASFESYRPDHDYPSQAEAVTTLRAFASAWTPARQGGLFSRSRKNKREEVQTPGVYLDGGFGVGKTHLLAALWHAAPAPKFYGTFLEYTSLVGALGYAGAVELLRGARLICIDEFELDDPGDTMMMTRMLGALVESGTRIAATSNTPPNALGEGRFAAEDFLREIQALSANFETIRIDGLDYRRRTLEGHALTLSADDLETTAAAMAARGARVTLDDFGELVAHLATIHPSKFVRLVDGLDAIALRNVAELHDQSDALRLVTFIDRVYDAEVPILAEGVPLDEVFDAEMLQGGYRKKYLRAASRMMALTNGDLPPHD